MKKMRSLQIKKCSNFNFGKFPGGLLGLLLFENTLQTYKIRIRRSDLILCRVKFIIMVVPNVVFS